MSDSRVRIARRVTKFLQNGDLVNLGIGLPTLVANYLPEGLEVEFQSENGLIGLGGAPDGADADAVFRDVKSRSQALQAADGRLNIDRASV